MQRMFTWKNRGGIEGLVRFLKNFHLQGRYVTAAGVGVLTCKRDRQISPHQVCAREQKMLNLKTNRHFFFSFSVWKFILGIC